MIDVHLIGYTADLRHLVLDLADGADGRYRLVVDADLFATVDQLRDERREVGLPVGDPEEFLTAEELAALREEEAEDTAGGVEEEPAPTAAREAPRSGMWTRDDALFGAADEDEDEDDGDEDADPVTIARVSDAVRLVAPSPFAPQTSPPAEEDGAGEPTSDRADEDDADEDDVDEGAADGGPADDAVADAEPVADPGSADGGSVPEPSAVEPKLSPAQIQALLRAGRSPRAVARDAGTDVAWIERWLPPILAERTRILDRAQAKRLERPRLGRSRDALGQAVARNLEAKGVPADTLTWEAARRKDGRWKVSVRFTQRDRPRTATWTYDPSDDELKPASDLAHELGFTRAKKSAEDEATPPARKRAAKPKERATGGRSTR